MICIFDRNLDNCVKIVRTYVYRIVYAVLMHILIFVRNIDIINVILHR